MSSRHHFRKCAVICIITHLWATSTINSHAFVPKLPRPIYRVASLRNWRKPTRARVNLAGDTREQYAILNGLIISDGTCPQKSIILYTSIHNGWISDGAVIVRAQRHFVSLCRCQRPAQSMSKHSNNRSTKRDLGSLKRLTFMWENKRCVRFSCDSFIGGKREWMRVRCVP